MKRLNFGLRAKLLIAVILIQGLMLTFLVRSSLFVLDSGLTVYIQSQVEELGALLDAALAGPVATQDIGSIDEILRSAYQRGGFRYLRLKDANGKLMAYAGIAPDAALPARDVDPLSVSDGVFDTVLPIEASGQKLGTLHYGLDISSLIETKYKIRRQGMIVASLMVLLSTLMILASTIWLSRRLRRLAQASHAIAEGRFDLSGMPTGKDEVGELTEALRYMSGALRQKIEDADREHARLDALITTMKLGILFVGPDSRVVYHNPAFNRIWQVDRQGPLQGKPAREVFQQSPCHLERPQEFDAHLSQTLASTDTKEALEIEIRDGRLITQQGYPVEGPDGDIIGHLFIYEDVTRERQAALQLVALAEHDSLTGLHNRHRFQVELARTVDDAFRNRSHCALLFFDLDEFKAINDHFGHGAGDALLIRVGNEVSRIVRRHESLFRLGGDEFAIVLPNADLDQARSLANRVVNAISGITLSFEGKSLRISSSLGIAVYPDQAHDSEQLVAYADAAMYQAKQAGKNTWRIYSADHDATPETLHRMTWNERLADALANDLFILHFQGVYDVRNGELHHLEALLRLASLDGGEPIMPNQFIPVAEKSQRIVEIDRWVLRRAIALLASHPDAPAIAVNLSGRSFDNPGMPDYIASLLQEKNVQPRRLLIEITETAAVSDLTDAQRFIDAIRATGCRVYLDDFGAGFASFAYLKHLAVDAIKIDGMFISDLAEDYENQVLVRGMVEVARGLEKITVAECVEDERVLELLADMGVTLAQGFHLDRPCADHPALGKPQT